MQTTVLEEEATHIVSPRSTISSAVKSTVGSYNPKLFVQFVYFSFFKRGEPCFGEFKKLTVQINVTELLPPNSFST